MVLVYGKQQYISRELLRYLYFRLCFQISEFWVFCEAPHNNTINSRRPVIKFFPQTESLPDEEDELAGESSGGLTDDEGIEYDHEETETVESEAGLSVRTSGTCEALISLCR